MQVMFTSDEHAFSHLTLTWSERVTPVLLLSLLFPTKESYSYADVALAGYGTRDVDQNH